MNRKKKLGKKMHFFIFEQTITYIIIEIDQKFFKYCLYNYKKISFLIFNNTMQIAYSQKYSFT